MKKNKKYKCLNCEDVFKKEQAHSNLDNGNTEKKEFLVCPNCAAKNLQETTAPLSEFYITKSKYTSEEWEQKFLPLNFTEDGFENEEAYVPLYEKALAKAKKLNDENPHLHIWSRIDSDDGKKLLLINGVSIRTTIDYCITEVPWKEASQSEKYIEVVDFVFDKEE